MSKHARRRLSETDPIDSGTRLFASVCGCGHVKAEQICHKQAEKRRRDHGNTEQMCDCNLASVSLQCWYEAQSQGDVVTCLKHELVLAC